MAIPFKGLGVGGGGGYVLSTQGHVKVMRFLHVLVMDLS